MSLKRILTIIIIILIVGLLAYPKIFPSAEEQKSTAPKAAQKNMPVKIGVFVTGYEQEQRSIEVSGNVIAAEEVELRSESQGRVVKIYFDEGSKVKAGDLLMKVNDADLQAQLKKVKTTLKLKEDTENRNKQLLDKGAISQEEYDMALTELRAVEADIELLHEQIRRTELRAPFNGLIGLRYVSEGTFVTNASQIASLQHIDNVKIEFAVPGKYANILKVGEPVYFSTDAMPEKQEAKLYAIEPKIDPSTRNVLVRALFVNAARSVLPGDFAKVSIPLSSDKQTLSVPTQSIVPILKGQKVFVVQGDSVVERVVKAGVRTDTRVEITEGLKVGDSVAFSGVMYLKQGSKVKIVTQ